MISWLNWIKKNLIKNFEIFQNEFVYEKKANITVAGIVIKQKRNAERKIDIDIALCWIVDVRFKNIKCWIIGILKISMNINGKILYKIKLT